MQVGFVGLGVMGGSMAMHLFEKGISLKVYNRSEEKRKPFLNLGIHVAENLAELAENCDVICLCVNKTDDVKGCLAEMQSTAKTNALFIDHSTISPVGAEEIHAELAAKGLRFIDAPITGGSMGAKNGTLTIFCGGNAEDIEEAGPILACYAKTYERVGGPGDGQKMKAANQIAVGGALLALCESLSFAQKCNLDIVQTRKLLSLGAAGSWAFENYGPKILNQDWAPGFSIDNQVKDFGYCEEAASEIGAAIPGTMLVHDLLLQLQAEGKGDSTTCLLFDLLLRLNDEDKA